MRFASQETRYRIAASEPGLTGSLLIEIGGHGNNLNEALYAGQLAANGLVQALLGPDT